MDDNGNALIVWGQDDGSYWQIYKSEYRNGTWSDPERVSASTSDAGLPHVAMDDSGNAIIVWGQYDYNSGTTQIYRSEYRNGTWSDPERVSASTGIVYPYSQVAMDDNGNAIIVWRQDDGSYSQIYKSEYR